MFREQPIDLHPRGPGIVLRRVLEFVDELGDQRGAVGDGVFDFERVVKVVGGAAVEDGVVQRCQEEFTAAEVAVEVVAAPNLREGGIWNEVVEDIAGGIVLPEGVEIAAEAVIIDDFQAGDEVRFGDAYKAAAEEKVGLSVEGKCGFGIDHLGASEVRRGKLVQKKSRRITHANRGAAAMMLIQSHRPG